MQAVHVGLLCVSDFGPDFSSDRQVIWQLWLFCEETEEPEEKDKEGGLSSSEQALIEAAQ